MIIDLKRSMEERALNSLWGCNPVHGRCLSWNRVYLGRFMRCKLSVLQAMDLMVFVPGGLSVRGRPTLAQGLQK